MDERSTIVILSQSPIKIPVKKILQEEGLGHLRWEVPKPKSLKRFSFENFKSNKYLAFLVGSVPHKTTAAGNNSSLASCEETVEGQPIICCRDQSKQHHLHLSVSSLRRALEFLKQTSQYKSRFG